MNTTLSGGARFSLPAIGVRSFAVAAFLSALGLGTIAILQVHGAEYVADKAASLSARHVAATETDTTRTMKEVHIANNGATLLRGARITDISGNEITVSLTWGVSDFPWSIAVNPQTKFIDHTGEPSSLNALLVGDVVTISGMLTANDGNRPSITAQFFHE